MLTEVLDEGGETAVKKPAQQSFTFGSDPLLTREYGRIDVTATLFPGTNRTLSHKTREQGLDR